MRRLALNYDGKMIKAMRLAQAMIGSLYHNLGSNVYAYETSLRCYLTSLLPNYARVFWDAISMPVRPFHCW